MKLLHIIATPRGEKSRTLEISEAFLAQEKSKNPGLEIDTLRLFDENLPVIDKEAADAKYVLMGGGNLSENGTDAYHEIFRYSKGFLSYDYYLISSPMWNFNIPYQLKHYIDVIMQAGILFQFTATGVEGLALNKKMFCITTRGSDYSPGTYMNRFDFQEPYLRAIFGLAGITDITFLNAQPMDVSPELTQAELKKAKESTMSMAMEAEVA